VPIGQSQAAVEIGNRKLTIGNIKMDDKLAAEEARRAAQHESVKSQVEGEVQSEISDRAATKATPTESRRIDEVAGDFRSRAVDEVVDTEREVQRSRGLARVSQIVDYIFYVIYALLGMRFLLALLAARSSAGFVRFIVAVSNPFYEPFRGIVASPQTDGGHTLMLPIVIAIVAYVLAHLLINALLRMLAHRKTEI
jgi:ABC-type multidrug transport system fused ATPase/permease subunit